MTNSSLILQKTNSKNQDFIELVAALDLDTQVRDGSDHTFHVQHNKIENIKHVIVAYIDSKAVGCGAFKKYNSYTVEIKRMYVKEENRGSGIAFQVLNALEQWAQDLSYSHSILETGKKYPEAQALYAKANYLPIPNYNQYIGIENSICFQKEF